MKALVLALLIQPFAFAGDLTETIAGKRLELASALIEALDSNQVCETDAYPTDINSLVATAWYGATETQKSAFLKSVPADSVIRQDLAFRSAIGEFNAYDQEQSEAEFAQALLGTVFHTFGQGAFGSTYNVTLATGGVAVEQKAELLDEEPWHRWNESRTTWRVRKMEGRFLLVIGSQEYRLQAQNGAFWWVPVEVADDQIDYQRTLSTDPGYCEA